MDNVPKMVRHSSEILQHLLQDFKSVSDHYEILLLEGLRFVQN